MSKRDGLAKSDSRFLMNWGERERERERDRQREIPEWQQHNTLNCFDHYNQWH